MQSIMVIKAKYGDEIRKVQLSRGQSLDELVKRIRSLFHISQSVLIKYRDAGILLF